MVPDAPSPAVGIESPLVAHGAAAAGSANGNSIFLRSSNLEDQQVHPQNSPKRPAAEWALQPEVLFMPKAVRPIPEGYHAITPYLVVKDAARALDFYRRAFGAKEIMRMDGPGGKITHAELRIGDSMIMVADEMPGGGRSPQSLGGSTVGIFLYVDQVDSVFNQAVSSGAKVEMPLADMFWGDRYGKLIDPFGHSWSVATHKEDVGPEEMAKRAKETMAKMGQQAQPVG
jgi:PhnB protein